MPTPKAIISPEAKEDLKEILDYTVQEWRQTQAKKYYTQIRKRCKELARYPRLAKQYKELKGQPYGYLEGKHIVFFHIKENGIEVIRILHGSMDYKRHL